MKRFEFSLDRLLRMKKQKERLAELDQAKARIAVDEAAAKVDSIREQLLRVSQQVSDCIGQAITTTSWFASYGLSAQLGQALEASKKSLQEAELKLWQVSQERAAISTEVEALETLRNQQLDVYKEEVQKSEQMRIDELGMRRWKASLTTSTESFSE